MKTPCLGLALLCTLVIQAAPAAAQAAATQIVYRCGSDLENLCRFTFDGAAPTSEFKLATVTDAALPPTGDPPSTT